MYLFLCKFYPSGEEWIDFNSRGSRMLHLQMAGNDIQSVKQNIIWGAKDYQIGYFLKNPVSTSTYLYLIVLLLFFFLVVIRFV